MVARKKAKVIPKPQRSKEANILDSDKEILKIIRRQLLRIIKK